MTKRKPAVSSIPMSVKEARAGLIPSEETEALPVVTLRVTHREYDTLIAALRCWQQVRNGHEPDSSAINAIASEHGSSLDNKQIDQFIGRVQFEEVLPIMVMEGGLIQDAFYPVPDNEGNPYTTAAYDLFDYDIFDGGDDATIAGHWNQLSDEARAYFRKHIPDAWVPVRKAIAREKRREAKAKMRKGGK